jgi:hypothetical protein
MMKTVALSLTGSEKNRGGEPMVMDEGRFDTILLSVAQQCNGIDELMDVSEAGHMRHVARGLAHLRLCCKVFFSFLRRKTDFYTGAGASKVEETVLKNIRKQVGS